MANNPLTHQAMIVTVRGNDNDGQQHVNSHWQGGDNKVQETAMYRFIGSSYTEGLSKHQNSYATKECRDMIRQQQ